MTATDNNGCVGGWACVWGRGRLGSETEYDRGPGRPPKAAVFVCQRLRLQRLVLAPLIFLAVSLITARPVDTIPPEPALVRPRELQRMSEERIPISKEGYEKLKGQYDRMTNEDMPRIAEAIALARAEGDLSENAEYDAQREAQGMLQARINELQDKLARAFIVDRSTLPTDRVVFGSKVRVLDLGFNEEEDFVLVGPGDEDYDQNKILTTSPIGQALVGKKINDEVVVPIPKGTLKLRILGITFD